MNRARAGRERNKLHFLPRWRAPWCGNWKRFRATVFRPQQKGMQCMPFCCGAVSDDKSEQNTASISKINILLNHITNY
jgi:hypothetical protein